MGAQDIMEGLKREASYCQALGLAPVSNSLSQVPLNSFFTVMVRFGTQ